MESPNTSPKITPKRSDIDIDLGRNMNGLKRNVYYLTIDIITGDSCSDWEADLQPESPICFQSSLTPAREHHPG